MELLRANLIRALTEHVEALERENDIRQHDEKWYVDKLSTMGGSSLAALLGVDKYKTWMQLVRGYAGTNVFNGNIATYWGNLFEDVLCSYIERVHNCKVLGANLYVRGSAHDPRLQNRLAYSPDGMTVMDIDGTPEIVLLEFKNPFRRHPGDLPPPQYVPQVLMGLNVLKIPVRGLLIEALFRRCALYDFDFTTRADTSLKHSRPRGCDVIAIGLIGFYRPRGGRSIIGALAETYVRELGNPGMVVDGFASKDLGKTSENLFTQLLAALVDRKVLAVWGTEISISAGTENTHELKREYIAQYERFCAENATVNFGVLAWKMMKLCTHRIDKQEDFMTKCEPAIAELFDVIEKCRTLPIHERDQYISVRDYERATCVSSYIPVTQTIADIKPASANNMQVHPVAPAFNGIIVEAREDIITYDQIIDIINTNIICDAKISDDAIMSTATRISNGMAAHISRVTIEPHRNTSERAVTDDIADSKVTPESQGTNLDHFKKITIATDLCDYTEDLITPVRVDDTRVNNHAASTTPTMIYDCDNRKDRENMSITSARHHNLIDSEEFTKMEGVAAAIAQTCDIII